MSHVYISDKVLRICRIYWHCNNNKPASTCCKGCPIKAECHQEIPGEEAQQRRTEAMNRAAEAVQL